MGLERFLRKVVLHRDLGCSSSYKTLERLQAVVAILRDLGRGFDHLIMFRLLRIELTDVTGSRELNAFSLNAFIWQAGTV
jgi:hypothetical protein